MDDPTALVYLVDDDPRVLEAMDSLLDAHGLACQCHGSVESFLAAHDPEQHGCLVLDVGLPGMSGFDLQDLLRREGIMRPIVFITGTGDIPASVRAMKGGAVTFLTKPVAGSDLLPAVQEALQMDQAGRLRRKEQAELAGRLSRLTPRERDVLQHLVAGLLNKQIAAMLGVAEKTVKVHRSSLMRKLQVRTPAALVALVAGTAGSTLPGLVHGVGAIPDGFSGC